VTNAGGPGVISTDALIDSGGQLAWLSEETMSQLNQLLPPHWSKANPIDLLGMSSYRHKEDSPSLYSQSHLFS